MLLPTALHAIRFGSLRQDVEIVMQVTVSSTSQIPDVSVPYLDQLGSRMSRGSRDHDRAETTEPARNPSIAHSLRPIRRTRGGELTRHRSGSTMAHAVAMTVAPQSGNNWGANGKGAND